MLPRRVGAELTAELTGAESGRFDPIGTRRAAEIGLVDSVFGDDVAGFHAQVRGLAEKLARHPEWHSWMEEKRRRRAADERVKPLEAYRAEEMARSHACFFGDDRSYHEARTRFVYKLGAPCVVAPIVAQADAEKSFVLTAAPVPAPPAPVAAPALSVVPAAPQATEAPAEVGWRLVSN